MKINEKQLYSFKDARYIILTMSFKHGFKILYYVALKNFTHRKNTILDLF